MLFGQEHVQRYVETDGEEGHDWNGTQTLILTVTGRTSGKQRSTPLIYGDDGADYVVVASNGGDPDHPEWYKNLVAAPQVRVQVKDDVFDAVARTATEEEKARVWPQMARRWPDYDNYQAKTDRSIPVVLLSRV
ncbi:deazaflavin-dependent oxidoreductase (nitroreductase family) [Murinocardiopsis flavida]|uniref:Deazaflavin-dependent oxidoreductase (Nitroreductase family) n=1 Tax=Murinocardiopsis flavida TaxID=645275 RepID=A0A2P8DLU6_9ACTN|nr:nitroreductase family deazaflavin-dependent oxidoreductase [Murinocardiopsis flavida]PSK98213.1 deazaflavin-dependent oxidoreductase (nitroreductase family) [Murinocardiopsis flavida]